MVIADLHIHSRFSRACSSHISIPNLEKYAKIKGVDILGTGDFTHPLWLGELKALLKDDGSGILRTGSGFRFILTTEVSNIFTQAGKGRRVHNVILAPGFDVVEQINQALLKRGRLDYDGRPVFGFSCAELVRMLRDISEDVEVMPGHCWTPWYGVFGSESGFDSLKDAFLEQEKHIHAIETGMSSDPAMNWRISELNSRSIVSFSDAHSFWPWRMGREATIFSKVDSYKDITKDIRNRTIEGTIETDPAYGKYHWDGHRSCNFSSSPEESRRLHGICPVCGRGLTIGVENRVEQIANQQPDAHPCRKHYYKMLPLHELVALAKAVPEASKKAWQCYNPLVERFGNELNVLLHATGDELRRALPDDPLLAGLILRNRDGRIGIRPGYDGVYGVALMDGIAATKNKKQAMPKGARQRGLADFA